MACIITHGKGDSRLGVDSLSSGFDTAGGILFEVTGMDGFAPLQGKSGHSLAIGYDGDDLLHLLRDIHGGSQLECVVVIEMHRAGYCTLFCKEGAKPIFYLW